MKLLRILSIALSLLSAFSLSFCSKSALQQSQHLPYEGLVIDCFDYISHRYYVSRMTMMKDNVKAEVFVVPANIPELDKEMPETLSQKSLHKNYYFCAFLEKQKTLRTLNSVEEMGLFDLDDKYILSSVRKDASSSVNNDVYYLWIHGRNYPSRWTKIMDDVGRDSKEKGYDVYYLDSYIWQIYERIGKLLWTKFDFDKIALGKQKSLCKREMISPKEYRNFLMEIYTETTDINMKFNFLCAMVRFGFPIPDEVIYSENWKLRGPVLGHLLMQTNKPLAISELKQELENDNPRIRMDVLNYLDLYGGIDLASEYLEILKNDPSCEVKKSALHDIKWDISDKRKRIDERLIDLIRKIADSETDLKETKDCQLELISKEILEASTEND